jgi:polyisoprenoid-binding protein YceI
MSLRVFTALSLMASLYLATRLLAAEAVPAVGGAAALSPQNTKIEFVCAHVGPRPDPRKGGFARFSGKAQLDGKSLQSISLDIDTTSIHTPIDKLTTHLKSPDFFEVRRFPTAKFQSTKIENAGDASQITGKLTLHGVTKDITIPAKIEVTDGGLKLVSEFTLNRLDYGINYDPKKVEPNVSLTVRIGQ